MSEEHVKPGDTQKGTAKFQRFGRRAVLRTKKCRPPAHSNLCRAPAGE